MHDYWCKTFICTKGQLSILEMSAFAFLYGDQFNSTIDLYRLVPTCITELFDTVPKRYSLRSLEFNIPHFHTVHYGKHSLKHWAQSLEQI